MVIMMTTELVVSNYSSVVVTTFTFLSFFLFFFACHSCITSARTDTAQYTHMAPSNASPWIVTVPSRSRIQSCRHAGLNDTYHRLVTCGPAPFDSSIPTNLL